jgi:hypothetical protein
MKSVWLAPVSATWVPEFGAYESPLVSPWLCPRSLATFRRSGKFVAGLEFAIVDKRSLRRRSELGIVQHVGQTAADAGIFAGATGERALCRNNLGVGRVRPITGDIGDNLIAFRIGDHAVTIKNAPCLPEYWLYRGNAMLGGRGILYLPSRSCPPR